MQQRDRAYLLDILEAARLVLVYVDGKTQEEFLEDLQCQDAVIRRLEIIGEAARRISEHSRTTLANLPWSDMVGMRNFLIHDYGDVDLNVIWDTVQLDMPSLAIALETILSDT